MNKFKRFVLLLLSASVVSGCASMDAVKDYSIYSQATIESVRPVAKDFHASCLRSNSYKPWSSFSSCDSEKEASEAILTIASVLGEYGAALGALAADELVDYETQVGEVTGELKKIGTFDQDKVDAVGNLASLIAKAATSAYQKKEVIKFVNEGDDSVIKVSIGLADIIETNYKNAISQELSAWEVTYQNIERAKRDSAPLEWDTYARAQWQYRLDLQAKLSAANGLAKKIRGIGETHHKIKLNSEKISGKEVYASIRTFINEAKPVIKEVQEAFSKK